MSNPSSTASTSSGLLGFFTNRRINTKIMIGFAVVLSLVAVLSVMSYQGLGRLRRLQSARQGGR